ncbi:MAG: nuclease (SNase) [Maricaulis sp.]|jgi:endonuclease YncB( thermonuclease family)|nr:nuclease (SNase) [Maricaulis sp.]HAQ36730.1 nuclease (SNase) [Alphaproteobacteria bacterium]
MRGIKVIFLVIGLVACGASAQTGSPGETGVLHLDGDRLVLTTPEGESLTVRPASILIPSGDAPLATEAAQALAELAQGRRAALRYPGEPRDRYGRAIAVVTFEDGTSVQDLMVAAGWARVYSWRGETDGVDGLLTLEAAAREAGRGIWSDPAYRIRTPDPNALALDLDSVQIVEGRVISTAQVRGRTYINFGFDYRSDFTVSIEAGDRRVFEAAGLDLLGLEGADVRVRGWIYAMNGPAITIDHPERLEIISPP